MHIKTVILLGNFFHLVCLMLLICQQRFLFNIFFRFFIFFIKNAFFNVFDSWGQRFLHQCFWVVADLKRRYRNSVNKWKRWALLCGIVVGIAASCLERPRCNMAVRSKCSEQDLPTRLLNTRVCHDGHVHICELWMMAMVDAVVLYCIAFASILKWWMISIHPLLSSSMTVWAAHSEASSMSSIATWSSMDAVKSTCSSSSSLPWFKWVCLSLGNLLIAWMHFHGVIFRSFL